MNIIFIKTQKVFSTFLLILSITMISFFILKVSLLSAEDIFFSSHYSCYAPGETIVLDFRGLPGNQNDWIGIYPKASSNDWSNVLEWSFTNGSQALNYAPGLTEGSLSLPGLSEGYYEARLFYDNSFELQAMDAIRVSYSCASIQPNKDVYAPYEPIVVNFFHLPGNSNDWIGIYPKDASNDWGNVITWSFTNGSHALNAMPGPVNGSVTLNGLPVGRYDIRLFFNNSFDLRTEAEINVEGHRIYGQSLGKAVSVETYPDGALYYPSDISIEHPTPVVLFVPGWGSQNASDYESLLRFIASQGYTAVYVRDPAQYSADTLIERFENLVFQDDVLPYLDTTRFGVVGHSSGGGMAFAVSYHFLQKGWGSNGKFVFAMAPWFSFDMTENAFGNLPDSLNVVILQFGNDMTTDPRIPLTIYRLLSRVPAENRDYVVLPNEGHYYPTGNKPFEQIQGVLRPLDALMDWVFNGNEQAYSVALENGNDDPVGTGIQEMLPSSSYEYKCYAEDNDALAGALNRDGIDYCHP